MAVRAVPSVWPAFSEAECRVMLGNCPPKPKRQTAEERRAARRDRHGWRTAAKVNKFGEPTRAAKKVDDRKHEVAVKAETRRKVWLRSPVCDYCGDSEAVTATKDWKRTHEQDEVKPRSLTRGEAPEVRFATSNTARACRPCHVLKTHKVIKVVYLEPARGMDGDVDIVRDGCVIHKVRR